MVMQMHLECGGKNMRTGTLEGLHKWLLMTKAERKKLEKECEEKRKKQK